jgi:hypothetical protein
MRRPLSANIDVMRSPAGPPHVVDDILANRYPVDLELWTKFYIKIAWCFGCKVLGSEMLRRHRGGLPLRLAKYGALAPSMVKDLQDGNPDLAAKLFRDAKVEKETVWFWRTDIDASANLIGQAQDESIRKRLEVVLAERARVVSEALRWVRITHPGNFTFNGDAEEIAARRFHRVRLFSGESDQRRALACQVELFGGVLAAIVQLTPAVLGGEYSRELVVEQVETVQF